MDRIITDRIPRRTVGRMGRTIKDGLHYVRDAVLKTRDGHVIGVWLIEDGQEHEASLYWTDRGGRTRFTNEDLAHYDFSAIRRGLYSGRFAVIA
mgnify:CR=1 FL=1